MKLCTSDSRTMYGDAQVSKSLIRITNVLNGKTILKTENQRLTMSSAFQIRAEKLDVLLEVTSPVDLATCKSVMDNLIIKMLEVGLQSCDVSCEATTAADAAGKQELIIEQVRVVNSEEKLKVVYPSRVDLQLESIKVIYQEK